MRKRHRDQRERALFSLFPRENSWLEIVRSFFFCQRQAEAKNFSRSDALVFKNFHSGQSLLFLTSSSSGKIENCLTTSTTRFWFLRSSFASHAIYKRERERERELSRGYADETKTDRRENFPLARTRAERVSKSG